MIPVELSKSKIRNEPEAETEAGIDFDKGFFDFLPFVKYLIEMSIIHAANSAPIAAKAKKIYENSPDKRVIVLKKFLGFGFSRLPEPLVTVYPDARGKWAAKVVRSNPRMYKSRILFPESWRGQSPEELVKITGISDAVFCHKSGFLACAVSKQGALKMVDLMMKENSLDWDMSKYL